MTTAAARTPAITSRLPNVGTTIFTVMSALAQQHGAVNLGQGFPDFDCDPRLLDAVSEAMRGGLNQYPPMAGVPVLREAVAAKIESLYGRRYDAGSEITITAGATQAIITAILAIVHPGDEVIVLDPCYDSYEPNIELAGGRAVHVPLVPGTFRPDFARIAAALSRKTRAIIVNTPHNPSATVWTTQDMQRLAELLRPTDVLLIADEVYEHMVYDGVRHESVARHEELAQRAFIVSSFGKTYHVTGWKVGYVAAPAALTAEFRKVHQFNVFTVNTPMQHGLAAFMADASHHLSLPAFYQRKRDLFRAGLAGSRFTLLPSEGSYFQCVDYSAISDETEESFCRRLTTQVGVAAIPLSAFYQGGFEQRIVRFCFAKKDETLNLALERLAVL
ncbi:pyridoxal phosphate-dependent aminotransferase [Rhizobacter sp. AJA081-3]|jgi:methionine aminotransferase|uniref:pyridoxal phosphate-dependent aminotransferase n=1 Tax=Rhizobacter sp. AJA081-3 TaxID=2753607 RepID=UPI001ADEF7D7|nr:pyridoxal phosphate-dependent aminotransferase [Rhizobacter sp. AJA081-3]QTN25273.1 pyridoxal phosphate-dependent aminotransferase [Rhizobacter sp. AJA081-3]